GISTSGRSPNVLAALTAAKARGMTTIALTGRDGGPIGAAADIHVNVAEASTPRVQEVHRTAIHAMCSLVEQNLKSSPQRSPTEKSLTVARSSYEELDLSDVKTYPLDTRRNTARAGEFARPPHAWRG